MPFLYPPDALSLLLLWIALVLLRQTAVDHLRIELEALRRMPPGRRAAPLEGAVAARVARILDTAARLAPKMTPARLLLVDRQARRMAREGRGALLAGCLGSGMAAPGPEARRLVLEIDLRLGAFVLFGSVSGWLLLVATLVRILWRLRGHAPGDRAEHFVDFSEHVASRLGRRTLRLALLSEGLPEAGPVAGTRP